MLSNAYRILLYSSAVAFLSLSLSLSSVAAVDGEQVFKTNCARCHAMDAKITGPALQGAFQRISKAKAFGDDETVGIMFKWIKNSSTLVDGDPYFSNLFKEYNGVPMDPMPTLKDEEVYAVIDYIKNWVPPLPVNGEVPKDDSSFPVTTILIVLAVVLIIIALILSRVTNVLGRIQKEKEGKKVEPEKPFYKTRKFITLVILTVTTVSIWWVSTRAVDLQRQQGYQPDQPIWFSHKVHAGVNKIDCRYCHVGVERGKQATIPSINVCMNCHKTIRNGQITGSKEIAKIYQAAGFDTVAQTYDLAKSHPVKWVRIHNLPDHVFFSHQQHVKVGGIQCQTCHGAVEEMDVLKQDAPLSMGWCLTCHRTTNIQFDNNDYYDNVFEKYHHELKEEHIKGVTVEMIGGTECQKCHY